LLVISHDFLTVFVSCVFEKDMIIFICLQLIILFLFLPLTAFPVIELYNFALVKRPIRTSSRSWPVVGMFRVVPKKRNV
jgi:hypothetical protein